MIIKIGLFWQKTIKLSNTMTIEDELSNIIESYLPYCIKQQIHGLFHQINIGNIPSKSNTPGFLSIVGVC